MKRGEILERVVPIPMKIMVQREDDRAVAVLPAWQMPVGMVAEAESMDEAIEALRVKVSQYWRGIPEE